MLCRARGRTVPPVPSRHHFCRRFVNSERTQNWWAHGAVSFIHNGGIPCRRGLRLDISTPSMTFGAPFECSRTLLMVATHEEHRLSRSSRDSQTSTTKNCTPERHFYPTIVSRVDQKWLSGRMKAHSVRLTPVASGMSEGTGRIRSKQSRSAANIKIMFFGVLRGTRGARTTNNFYS